MQCISVFLKMLISKVGGGQRGEKNEWAGWRANDYNCLTLRGFAPPEVDGPGCVVRYPQTRRGTGGRVRARRYCARSGERRWAAARRAARRRGTRTMNPRGASRAGSCATARRGPRSGALGQRARISPTRLAARIWPAPWIFGRALLLSCLLLICEFCRGKSTRTRRRERKEERLRGFFAWLVAEQVFSATRWLPAEGDGRIVVRSSWSRIVESEGVSGGDYDRP